MALESGNTASSSSSSSADTYIGSRISVISKSEIRYEGLLYCLNPQDSTLGLNNVRSYGTEGRVKDGPQIPPSDKVYEYILFRGSDIKDLQVKSSPSPPAQPEEQIHNDPAIIQSSFSGGPPSTSKTAPFINGSLTDSNPYNDNTKSYTSLIPEPWNQNTNISSYTIPSQWQGYNDVTGHNNNNTTTQNPTQFTNAPLPSNTSNHGSLFWKSPSQSYPELLGGTNVTSSASYPVSSFVDPTSGQLHYPPRLLTPDQLSQPRASELPGPQKLYPDQKDMSVNVISSAYSNSSPPVQPPLLPLPPPTQKLQFSRGFSEEFDFEAMNEKFKKDEIWGSLGKAKQENHSEGITYGREMSNNGFFTESETKRAYKKDDFFDSMSRNSNSRGGKNGQSSFSNRMKLDTETFGNYHHQAGRGGFGVGRGRRGYHYRGRGRSGPMRP